MLEQYGRAAEIPRTSMRCTARTRTATPRVRRFVGRSRICVLKHTSSCLGLVAQVDVIRRCHRDVRNVVLSSMLMFGACFARLVHKNLGKPRRRAAVPAVRALGARVCYDAIYERMKLNYTSWGSRG